MDERRIEFAVKALIIKNRKFLAMHQTTIKSPKYELPGGRMQFGETAEETVAREVYEETRLRITPIRLVDTWNFVTDARHITGVIYLCSAKNTKNIVLSDEHDQYEWLSPDAESLEKMQRLFKPQMLRWDWDILIDESEASYRVSGVEHE